MFTFSKRALEDIKTIDWTFPNHSSNGHITSLHPYPARFIPIIPRKLIEGVSSNRRLKILDPFAGCGTSLYEGLDTGNNVVGIDVNALAILLQRVYTHSYSEDELNMFSNFYSKIALYSLKDDGLNNISSIPNVDHWFNKDSKEVLSKLMTLINYTPISEPVKDLAKFSISRIIVKISNQQSDTQYRAITKTLDKKSVIDILVNSFKDTDKAFRKHQKRWKGVSLVIQGDAREENTYSEIRNVDLIITSPPYPNAYEYWLYHKYRMYWLNLDPLWSRSHEIGARPFYSGGGKLDESDFQEDMERVFRNLYKVTHKDSVQFWIIGDSIIKGRLIDNANIITNACSKYGWKVLGTIKRNLVRSKSSFQGIGRQKKEEILVIVRR